MVEDEMALISCTICLNDVVGKGDRGTARLPCGHEFHLDCISKAFNTKGKMQCPNCRRVEKGSWASASGSDSQIVSFNDSIDANSYDSPALSFNDWIRHHFNPTFSALEYDLWCPYSHLPYVSPIRDDGFASVANYPSYHAFAGPGDDTVDHNLESFASRSGNDTEQASNYSAITGAERFLLSNRYLFPLSRRQSNQMTHDDPSRRSHAHHHELAGISFHYWRTHGVPSWVQPFVRESASRRSRVTQYDHSSVNPLYRHEAPRNARDGDVSGGGPSQLVDGRRRQSRRPRVYSRQSSSSETNHNHSPPSMDPSS